MKKINIPTASTMSLLEIQAGGFQNMWCTERDVRNFERDIKNEKEKYDAEMLIQRLKDTNERNPDFKYAYKVDSENRLTHCFWMDKMSIESYVCFGDVVVFDTTYNTNQYKLVFAPFAGVNHHGQSILMGCGLIQDETTESLVWLFEVWLEAVSGRHPNAIITDQDPAMGSAIKQVFPHIHRRYCIWHITEKLPNKLGPIAYMDKFRIPFKDCIWNSEIPEEFESKWAEVIRNNKLEGNEWLCELYRLRNKWVPALLRHIFFAGMSSSQRSESMNSILDKYVCKKTTLIEFIFRLESALSRQWELESKEDFDAINSHPELKTSFDMEKQMAKIYTKHNFAKFQHEMLNSINYNVHCEDENGDLKVYKVHLKGKPETKRDVKFQESTKICKCGCHKFEFEGIPCCHVLAILLFVAIVKLPKFYILKRLTKEARSKDVVDFLGEEIQGDCGDSFVL